MTRNNIYMLRLKLDRLKIQVERFRTWYGSSCRKLGTINLDLLIVSEIGSSSMDSRRTGTEGGKHVGSNFDGWRLVLRRLAVLVLVFLVFGALEKSPLEMANALSMSIWCEIFTQSSRKGGDNEPGLIRSSLRSAVAVIDLRFGLTIGRSGEALLFELSLIGVR